MTEAEKRTEIFERMPVRRAVQKQIIPAVAGQMIALIYNLADTYFVGMLNDPNETAAVTVVSSSFLMLTAISNLFGVGGASLLARCLGQRDTEGARRTAGISFWWGMIGGCAFSAAFLALASPILTLCGADADTYALAFGYAKWTVVIGGPATILNTLLANLIRAEGGAVAAAAGVSFGGLLNIALDPLFVLPAFLGYGAVGAGAATALSNIAAMLFFLVYLLVRRRTTLVSLDVRHLRYTRVQLPRILSVGLPSAVQYALTVVAVSAQMHFVSTYGTAAIAGLGIVKKLDQLPLYFSMGVANGLLPLLAYNYAAGNDRRRRDVFRLGCFVSVAFALLCLVCYELFAPALVGLFIDDAVTQQYGAAFLRIMVTAMPLMAVCYPMIIQFQAMGKAKASLVCSVLRKGVLDIPLLFLLDGLLPLYGCMMVQPIVDAVSLVAAVVFYLRINRAAQAESGAAS